MHGFGVQDSAQGKSALESNASPTTALVPLEKMCGTSPERSYL